MVRNGESPPAIDRFVGKEVTGTGVWSAYSYYLVGDRDMVSLMPSNISGLISELRALLVRWGGAEDPALNTLAARRLELAVWSKKRE